ncbi:MAG TPA: FAD-binding protein, partial [Beijerinckiaceae bacterium]|nr:FAD-binding protein [Beijerinckiaceae bacterium]
SGFGDWSRRRLAEVEAALAAKGQMLPFEPLDHRILLGSKGTPTIGAVAAGNLSGPRRISAGAARDSLIGVRFVNGRGEAIKSGGRVMKNVTGLDLVKLQCGAHGTLGPLTEVIFKVLPAPETVRTLVLQGLDDKRAVAALATAMGTPFEVSGSAHLPAGDPREKSRTVIRLEGFADSLAYRADALAKVLKPFGASTVLDEAESRPLWQTIRDAAPLASGAAHAIWRLSVKPTAGPDVVAAIRAAVPLVGWFYDWSGGLVWLAAPATGDGGATAVRAAVTEAGGHATLVKAPADLRTAVPVFQPEALAVARLAEGIRRSIDPDGLFNPGLMG